MDDRKVAGALNEPDAALARLIASGRVTAPRRDLLSLVPPRGRTSTETSQALAEDRGLTTT
jgi:hypothetical protein